MPVALPLVVLALAFVPRGIANPTFALILAGAVVGWALIFGTLFLPFFAARWLTKAIQGKPVETPRFSLATFSPSLGLGMNGFRAKSGGNVGGGSYREIQLETDELVIEAETGGYGTSPHNSGSGYITLTDRRIIFTGYKRPWLYKEYFALGTVSIPYSEIETWRLEKRHAYSIVSFFRSALVLTAKNGKEHTFWPLAGAEQLQQSIDRLKKANDERLAQPDQTTARSGSSN
jgi:hypothetical protein